MRVSNQKRRGILAVAPLIALSAIAAACGSSAAPSVAVVATPPPTPVITPDPHLTEPATADEIFNAIRKGDLPLSVNNATAGAPNDPLVKKINAQIGNWPLIISEYRNSALLRQQLGWNPASGVKQGDPPFTWVGMNIVVTFGPTTGAPAAADPARQEQAKGVVALIDPLLWPLEQRSLTPIPSKTPPTAPPASAAPASAPAATAAP
ncbi:MAG TPA: hypothetical protein VFV72_00370 [Candidatus Limnocylindrales bacterium]|nr:hypothetical protein [Candidatus Limnocylindrales bacterium]